MQDQSAILGNPLGGSVGASAQLAVETRLFTPETATALLAQERPANRAISVAHVHALAQLMRNGLWRTPAAPIMLDHDGRLLDGQNRLSAVVEANAAIEFVVLRGYEPSVLTVLDTGRIRSGADTLSMRGLTNTRNRAGALRLLIAWERSDNPWRYLANTRISNTEVADAVERFDGLDDALTRARRLSTVHIPGGDAFWAALLFRFAELDSDSANEFSEALRDGVGLDRDSPVRLLRNRLLGVGETESRSSIHAVHKRQAEGVAALAIKAWNAWYDGRPLRQLKWISTRTAALGQKAEPFPTIEGLPSASSRAAAA